MQIKNSMDWSVLLCHIRSCGLCKGDKKKGPAFD